MQTQQSGPNVTLTIVVGAVYPEDSAAAAQQATVIAASPTAILFTLGANNSPAVQSAQVTAAAQLAQTGVQTVAAPVSEVSFKPTLPDTAVTLTASDGSDPIYKLTPQKFVVFVDGLG